MGERELLANSRPKDKTASGKNLQAQIRVSRKLFAKPCCIRRKPVSTTEGVSGCGVRFNRQLHPDEKQVIADKAGSDKAEANKLTKAACIAVKCWAEYPMGSDAYNTNYVSQLDASQLGAELTWVDQLKEAGLGVSKFVAPSVIPSMFETVGANLTSETVSAGVGNIPSYLPKKK